MSVAHAALISWPEPRSRRPGRADGNPVSPQPHDMTYSGVLAAASARSESTSRGKMADVASAARMAAS